MTVLDDLKGRLETDARPCVKLVSASARSTSYIGGVPELPGGMEWPAWKGEPLSFVAQLDLDAAPKANWPDWMPRTGKLLFFYDTEQTAWGFDPADKGRSLVAHFDNATERTERRPPTNLAEFARFKRKDVTFSEDRSRPSYERIGGYQAKLSDEEFDEINDFISELESEAAPQHQLFGWPSPVQGDDMELESQLASNGVYVGTPDGYRSKRARELEPGAKDWELLLQVDTDGAADMMWGDVGKLYFWIRREDAARGDFSNVWVILQCS